MICEKALEKLRQLRSSADWHEQSLGMFDDWKKQLEEIELNEKIWELPPIKKLAESLAKRYLAIEKELSSNRHLTQQERDYYFAIKEICQLELAVLSKDDAEKVAKQIERDIDYEKDIFKNA